MTAGATLSSVVLTVFDARLPFVAASNAEFAGRVIELGPCVRVTCIVYDAPEPETEFTAMPEVAKSDAVRSVIGSLKVTVMDWDGVLISDGNEEIVAVGCVVSSVAVDVFDTILLFPMPSITVFAGKVIELAPSPSVTCMV